MSVILETTIGDIVIDLYTVDRPQACLNFLKLCKIKYYNFCLFHKVESNFIAQTGDPSGNGREGESIFSKLYGNQAQYFEAETQPRLKHTKLGTVSMVNNGNDMHASQFFVTLGENLDYLDNVHTVFGEVAEGFEILEKFNEVICDDDKRPYQDIRITHTVIIDDPFDDPAGLEIPDRSPEPTKEQLKNSRIGADEELDDMKGKSLQEIEEEIQSKEANARATILEMVGDLPEAEAKPEENVLFVCKLNPVTTDEDLQIIFSRFGAIKSCEVIRDKKTGESLQYAFIEFSNPAECENAYFKMDNVLIDDRRIHVDFSQSVAHLTWKKQTDNKSKGYSNLKIKDKTKTDGYDLIFDDDDRSRKDEKYSSSHNERKSSHSIKSSKKSKKNETRERSRSRSPRRHEYSSRRHEHHEIARDSNSPSRHRKPKHKSLKKEKSSSKDAKHSSRRRSDPSSEDEERCRNSEKLSSREKEKKYRRKEHDPSPRKHSASDNEDDNRKSRHKKRSRRHTSNSSSDRCRYDGSSRTKTSRK